MQSSCIVTVAFREPYLTHNERQYNWIKENHPDLKVISFRDMLPAKGTIHTDNVVSHFQKSLYGFKPHAIQKAIDYGFKKVIWLDPSVLPSITLAHLFNALDEHPVIVRKGEHPLADMTNQKAMNWFGVTKEDIKDVKHIGGTVYGFNFDNQKAVDVFHLWKKAEEEGIFGTQDDFMAGHWADESCMALSLFKNGVEQYWKSLFTYQNQKEL